MRAPLLHRALAHFAPIAVVSAALTGSSTSALGQVICTGPDGLGIAGSCCALVTPNLPNFGAVNIPGLGICYQNCTVATQNAIKIDLSPPSLIQCQEYVSLMTVQDVGSGTIILSGKIHLAYTRTWDEVDPSGSLHQVWRFAVKADLAAVAGGAPVCPLPRCLPPFATQPTAFFYGYLDYTSLCGTTISENSLVLMHQCDFFIHKPGFSSRPGAFHPNESYAIVAPHSTAQPFIPGINPVAQGPLFLGGTREVANIPGGLCVNTNPLQSAQIANLGGACLCPPAAFPKQIRFRSLQGSNLCPLTSGSPSTFQALNFSFPTVPWFNLMTTSIGRWSNPNVYPGQEAAFVDEGLFLQNEACSGQWVSVQYGGSTRFGWAIAHPVLISSSTDLADNYTAPIGGPYPLPIFGNIINTDRVLFLDGP